MSGPSAAATATTASAAAPPVVSKVAASAAEAATAATWASATAAATKATAATAGGSLLRLVDAEFTPFQREFSLQSEVCRRVLHFYERESPRAPGLTIRYHSHRKDFADISEDTSNIVFRR